MQKDQLITVPSIDHVAPGCVSKYALPASALFNSFRISATVSQWATNTRIDVVSMAGIPWQMKQEGGGQV